MDIREFHSELDSARFGYNVAKINNFDYPANEIISILRKNNYKLIISKINANDISLINQLEEEGFLLKDIQVTYKYELSETYFFSLAADTTVREALLSDKDMLYQIAMESFDGYGHYAADTKIDIKHCKKIYGDWIIRSYDNNIADNIIVAEINGEIAGFLSHKIHTDQYRYAVGGIGAVMPKYRNRDIFRAITISGINWALSKNCNWVEHNVLVTNPPVMRSFAKLGFKPANSSITFHKWL